MTEYADALERRATQYDEGDDYSEFVAQLHDKMDRHDRQRKSDLRHARIINCVVVGAIAFGCWAAFLGLPYLVHDLIQAVRDAWSWL
jgi:hypothetical protein